LPQLGNFQTPLLLIIEVPLTVELRGHGDGSGIDSEILPHIFEPFLTTKESGHRVGLGLDISRSIVERHGGALLARSRSWDEGQFSFAFAIPGRDGIFPRSGTPRHGDMTRELCL
jgi:signal transduction histidine kinase